MKKIEFRYPEDERKYNLVVSRARSYGSLFFICLVLMFALSSVYTFANYSTLVAGALAVGFAFTGGRYNAVAREMLIVCDCHVTEVEAHGER